MVPCAGSILTPDVLTCRPLPSGSESLSNTPIYKSYITQRYRRRATRCWCWEHVANLVLKLVGAHIIDIRCILNLIVNYCYGAMCRQYTDRLIFPCWELWIVECKASTAGRVTPFSLGLGASNTLICSVRMAHSGATPIRPT